MLCLKFYGIKLGLKFSKKNYQKILIPDFLILYGIVTIPYRLELWFIIY